MADKVQLTDAKLKGLKPPASGQVEIADTNVQGLRAVIGGSGIITFVIRKRIGGKWRKVTVGRYGPRLTLAQARANARQILTDIEAGKDVTATARVQRDKRETLADLLPSYIKAKAGLRSIKESERIFNRYILPKLGDRMADTVTRGDVTRLIDKIAETAPVQARAVHAILSSFYTWALPRLDRLPANPCQGAGRPDKPPSRERVLTDAEIRALWRVADGLGQSLGQGVQLLLLTGQRRLEVFHAARAEFDLSAALWTIPPERAKNGQANLVPLSAAAIEIVNAIPQIEDSPLLFPSRDSLLSPVNGFSKLTERLRAGVDKALERQDSERWTLHDIRRTVATGLQRLGIRQEVTEAALNHKSGIVSGVAAVYSRHDFADEKRAALDAWAIELRRIVEGQDATNVVKLRG